MEINTCRFFHSSTGNYFTSAHWIKRSNSSVSSDLMLNYLIFKYYFSIKSHLSSDIMIMPAFVGAMCFCRPKRQRWLNQNRNAFNTKTSPSQLGNKSVVFHLTRISRPVRQKPAETCCLCGYRFLNNIVKPPQPTDGKQVLTNSSLEVKKDRYNTCKMCIIITD